MEKQITAVEWLINELGEYFPIGIGGIELMVKKAKEIEKQQIINTCKDVDSTDFWVKYEGFEEYYNDKFKK